MAGQSRSDKALKGPLTGREGPETYSTLWSQMPELTVVSLFLNVLSLALPLVLLQVYDRIVPNAALGTLSFLVLGIGGALLMESLLRLGRSYITGWVGARFEHMAGVAALRRMLFTGIQDFERSGSGEHLERIGSLAVVKDFYAGQSLISIIDLPFAFVYLGIIYLLGGWLVVVPFALLLLFMLTAFLLGLELKAAIKDRMTFDDRRINFIIEILNGSHTLKSMAMEAQMLRRYERLQETCGKGNFRVALASAWALSAGSFFSQATMVATVAVGSYLVIEQLMTVGALAACTLLAGRSLQPVQKVLGVWTRFQTIRLAQARLRQIFDLEPEAPSGLPEPEQVFGRLTLSGVSFQFEGTDDTILHDLYLDAAPGECIGISGGNGSGKSTLLGLMSGSLKPSDGEVLLDGENVLSYDPKGIKRHVAYLPQNGELFRGSILDNITMFEPEANEQAIAQAEDLGLGPVVAAMAFGYDTVVGEGSGESLPRGIRQRIAVARALLPNPQVVLFDEANTAVDGAGDEHLKKALEKLKGERTIILVTHRPSLLRVADRVFDLENGTLTERVPEEGKPGFTPPAATAAAAVSAVKPPEPAPIVPVPLSPPEPIPETVQIPEAPADPNSPQEPIVPVPLTPPEPIPDTVKIPEAAEVAPASLDGPAVSEPVSAVVDGEGTGVEAPEPVAARSDAPVAPLEHSVDSMNNPHGTPLIGDLPSDDTTIEEPAEEPKDTADPLAGGEGAVIVSSPDPSAPSDAEAVGETDRGEADADAAEAEVKPRPRAPVRVADILKARTAKQQEDPEVGDEPSPLLLLSEWVEEEPKSDGRRKRSRPTPRSVKDIMAHVRARAQTPTLTPVPDSRDPYPEPKSEGASGEDGDADLTAEADQTERLDPLVEFYADDDDPDGPFGPKPSPSPVQMGTEPERPLGDASDGSVKDTGTTGRGGGGSGSKGSGPKPRSLPRRSPRR